jgi:sucrose-6-phosphate hydrolase SacC (GH32 family)
MIAAPMLFGALFFCGCSEEPARSTGLPCLDAGAAPTFLQSKLDDDDGDGNPYDEDFPRINDEDDDIADHAWIQDDWGVYHLFFQTEDHGAGSRIEHYVSTDLQSLTYVGTALGPDPQGWDSYGLWAPHVIRVGRAYYMFYTGIDGPGGDPATRQRIGLAVSSDLRTWARVAVNRCPGASGEGCIYQCDECWTTWGAASGSYNQQCRDPFVIWDPVGRRWVMFVTAKSVNGYGVVTVASSTNLTDWAGAGFIDATRRLENGAGAQATGGQAENPFVTSHDGTYYLLFTDWLDPEDSATVAHPRTIVQYATSTTLSADTLGSPNWVYRGYTPDPGVNAVEVVSFGGLSIMSESVSNERSAYYPTHRRQLVLRGIVWSDGLGFGASNVDFHCGEAGRATERGPFSPSR